MLRPDHLPADNEPFISPRVRKRECHPAVWVKMDPGVDGSVDLRGSVASVGVQTPCSSLPERDQDGYALPVGQATDAGLSDFAPSSESLAPFPTAFLGNWRVNGLDPVLRTWFNLIHNESFGTQRCLVPGDRMDGGWSRHDRSMKMVERLTMVLLLSSQNAWTHKAK